MEKPTIPHSFFTLSLQQRPSFAFPRKKYAKLEVLLAIYFSTIKNIHEKTLKHPN
jgi:hypothetical protein